MTLTSRQRTVVVTSVATLAYLGWITGLYVTYLFRREVDPTGGFDLAGFMDSLLFSAAFVGLPAVGAVVAIRRPENPVGWTILALGALMYVFSPIESLVELAVTRHGTVDGPVLWVAGITNALSPLAILAFAHLLFFFPNGELTGRMRWVSRAAVVLAVLTVAVRLLRPGKLDMSVELENPFGQSWLPGGQEPVGTFTALLFMVVIAALARLIVRYRKAGTTERKQFQWILASIATLPLVWVAGNLIEESEANYYLGQFIAVGAFDIAFLGFAFALYRAITKQDLYGIDRVVSRTLTYTALTAVLVGVYLGLVVGLGAAARSLTGESGDVVVALSTLAVAALFQPTRRRIQAAVDHRFNRARYDAAQTVDSFARSLRDELDLGRLTDDLALVARGTMQPIHAGIWLARAPGGAP